MILTGHILDYFQRLSRIDLGKDTFRLDHDALAYMLAASGTNGTRYYNAAVQQKDDHCDENRHQNDDSDFPS
jgi:hypothetical protein